jgi:hypothetical protein
MTVLVAIPVYERASLVRHCFLTAAELVLPDGSAVAVFDDASPTLDAARLIAETGLDASFERFSARRGAEHMVALVWERFLSSAHSHLLFLDSDMIVNRLGVTDGLARLQGFAGLLSLYNSQMLPGLAGGSSLVTKSIIGNAGTFWTRDLARLALDGVGACVNNDRAYSALFGRMGIRLAATEHSRIQHLGIVGVHGGRFGALDYGLGFVPDSVRQLEAIAFVYDELLSHQADYLP